MKKGILLCMLSSLLILTSISLQANTLQACETSECVKFFKSYRILSKQGHSTAMAILGELYATGYGTEKNPRKALKWLKRAGKYGIYDAKHKAALIYLSDSELKDIEEGIEFLKFASRRHHSRSSFLLGQLYLDSEVVKQDLKQADQYLTLAYNQSHPETLRFAHRLYLHPTTKQLPLPALYKQVQQNPHHTEITTEEPRAKIQFPEGEMETIIATMETFEHVFHAHTTLLSASIPDVPAGTGSYITGQTCAHMVGCTSVKKEFFKDAILDATWTSK